MNVHRPGPSDHPSPLFGHPYCGACFSTSWHMYSVPEIFVTPLRSQWAPPMTNEFLCGNCYNFKVRRHRERCPPLANTPCLCIRRDNLQYLLLNKRISSEAAYVFWTENCFAFDTTAVLADFLASIRPESRALITKLCIMTHRESNEDSFDEVYFRPPRHLNLLPDWRNLKEVWGLLGQCHGLVELELDDVFLSRLKWVYPMMKCLMTLKSLKRVTFVRQATWFEMRDDEVKNPAAYNKLIYPSLAKRQVMKTPIAEAVSSGLVRKKPLNKVVLRDLLSEDKARRRREEEEWLRKTNGFRR